MPEPNIDWLLEADFDNNGSYEADLTPYIRGPLRYGIGREDALAAFGMRTLSVALNNQDSRFSPKNTAGPYGTNLKRGRRVRLTASPGRTFGTTTNIVENPSAETNANGWVVRNSSTVVRDTTNGYWGRAAIKVTTANLNQSGTLLRRVDGTTRFSVTGGLNYVFRAMLTAPAGKPINFAIRWFNSTPALIGEDVLVTETGRGADNWFLAPIDLLAVAAPGTAVTAELSVDTSGAQGVFDFWVDGAFFYQSSSIRPYVDGDQPAATWAGTAHASQSTRLQADQTIVQFTGRIRDFRVSRDPGLRGTMVMECSSDEEAWYHKVISCGAFTRKKATLIAHRLVDVLEEGEIILDGAHRTTPTSGTFPNPKTPNGETYVAVGTGQTWAPAASGKTDPADYAAMEGDNVMVITWFNNVIGDGWEIDVNSRTATGTSYTVSCFFATEVLNNGKRFRFQLIDGFGTVAETTVTLVAGAYVYATVSGTFASTGRKVRVVAQDTPVNESNGLLWDCLHMVPTANRIARTITGLDYDLEIFPQGGFHRSATAILEEFARSACAWVYEDASGGLIFEQADTSRANTATPKLRLSDYLDGLGFALGDYVEGMNNIYNRIRVGSYGKVSHIGATRRVWQLEPGPLVLGANEERTLYVDFTTEEQGMMLARLATAKAAVTAGAIATHADGNYPWLRGFGGSAEIVVKAGAAGATVSELWAEARIQNRNTNERTFVEYTPGGSPISEPKFLELETPGQGYKTTKMTNLATWAGDKYVNGPAHIDPVITAGAVGVDDAGVAAWYYIMEIIGRDVGLPVWVKHKNGPASLFLDELYYVEGRTVEQAAQNELPQVTLHLEAA